MALMAALSLGARAADPLEVLAYGDPETIAAGETATLYIGAIGGEEPYTYVWRDQQNNPVGEGEIVEVNPAVSTAYYCDVTSADGQKATAKTWVAVTGSFMSATFDDNFLTPDTGREPESDDDRFYSGSLMFPGQNFGTYWNGFALTSETSNIYESLADDQLRSAPGGARSGRNFCVNFPYEYDPVRISNDPESGVVIPGVYLTNTAYARTTMLEGNPFAKKFEEGDYFTVIVTGKDNEGKEKRVEFYLADFRAANAADRYILDTWEWVDLSPLGEVVEISFSFDGSDQSKWGVNTPGYVAIDDFGVSGPDREAFDVVVGGSGGDIDLNDYLPAAAGGATASYSVSAVGELPEGITIAAEGNMVKIASSDAARAEFQLAASRTVKGHTDYLTLNVAKEEQASITTVGADATAGAVYFDLYGRRVVSPEKGMTVIRVDSAGAKKIRF